VDLVAIADPPKKWLEGLRTYKVELYSDYRTIDREKPVLVTVAVPTAQHAEAEAISRAYMCWSRNLLH